MKRFLTGLVGLCLVACSSVEEEQECPAIEISRENLRVYQTDNVSDKLQITLSGYEAYCYTDERNKRRYAVIAPIFKVRRLEESPVSESEVNFYIKTNGAEKDYIRFRTFPQNIHILRTEREKTVRGKEISVRIAPKPYQNFSLELGLDGNKSQKARSKQMFDIDYRYFTQEEIASQNAKATENKYLEVFSDEEVIYSDQNQRPEVVKKNRKKEPCQN